MQNTCPSDIHLLCWLSQSNMCAVSIGVTAFVLVFCVQSMLVCCDTKCCCILTIVLCTVCPQIVRYEGDLLLQGAHNNVPIVLLEESVPDGAASGFIKQRKSSLTPDSPRRGRAFSGGSLQSSQSKVRV